MLKYYDSRVEVPRKIVNFHPNENDIEMSRNVSAAAVVEMNDISMSQEYST